jgi:hypothetical protein
MQRASSTHLDAGRVGLVADAMHSEPRLRSADLRLPGRSRGSAGLPNGGQAGL